MNFSLRLPPGLTACTHAAMATEFVLHLGGHDPAYLRQAATEAFALIDMLEARLSFYRETSDVTRLNRAPAGTDVPVVPETITCLELAAEAAQLTGGAFNAFTGRAALAAKNQEVPPYLGGAPDPGAGDRPGPVVSLHPESGVVHKLRAGPWLDLGALGKGFALDQVALLLTDWGISTGCLLAGGSSLRGLGGTGWTLEMGPPPTRYQLPAKFCLGASGFLFQPGHIIDPREEPESSGTARALVLAPDAALADALSTAAMLLRPEQLDRLTRQRPDIASYVCSASGSSRRNGSPFA